MSKNKFRKNAKREAYAEKQEQEGRSIINWIFAVLVALGVIFAIYSAVLYS